MKKKFEYLIPGIVTFLIFLVYFLITKVYPFGNNTIVHYDFANQSYFVLIAISDLLKGEIGLFYNFNLGGGINFLGTLIGNGIFSPSNWIIGLISRDSIPGFLSWFVMIKFILISDLAYYVFKKIFKQVDKVYLLCVTILYTFSPYTLMYYVNFQWIECWGIFPLVMLGLKNIIDNKSSILYTVSLTIMLVISYYMSYLTLMIIVFGGIVALVMFSKKENYAKAGSKILLNTILALCISCVSFLPGFEITRNSLRVEESIGLYNDNPIFFKMIHIFSPILIVFWIKNLLNYKLNKKKVLFYGLISIITMIPIIIEPINKMWHTGSYTGLPYRYGFITTFIMCCSMLEYFSTSNFKNKKIYGFKKSIVEVLLILLILTLFIVSFTMNTSEIEFVSGNISFANQETLLASLIIFIVLVSIVSALLTVLDNEKTMKLLLIIVVLLNSLMFMKLFMNEFESVRIDKNKDEETIYYAQNAEKMWKTTDKNYKTKDIFTPLTENYPYAIRSNSLTNWYHFISTNQAYAYSKLGYSRYQYIQYSFGGTLISDSVLGNKYIFDKDLECNDLYKILDEYKGYGLYEYNFIMPSVCKLYSHSEEVDNFLDLKKSYDLFEIQNELGKAFFNEDELIKITEVETSNKEYVEKNIEISNKSNLYLSVYDATNARVIIKVTDENQNIVRTIDEDEVLKYYDGIIDIGVFEEGKYTIIVIFNQRDDAIPLDYKKLELGLLDLDRFILSQDVTYKSELNIEKNSFTVRINAKHGDSLFIPINYDKDWKVLVNGKEKDINICLGSFMSVELEEGDNYLEFKYVPSAFILGLKITLISSTLYILVLLINKKVRFEDTTICKVLYKLLFIIYIIIVLIFIFVVYIKPLI